MVPRPEYRVKGHGRAFARLPFAYASAIPPPMRMPTIVVECPAWVDEVIDWERRYVTDEQRMRVAIELSRQNVVRRTGGPFGAVIVEAEHGQLIAVGINSVVRLNNCTLHGEMVAIMMAQARLGSYTLRSDTGPAYEMVTSCEPCAMCLGATLWSGVRRVVCGANREDARRLSFDEGPVFKQSHDYLEARGVEMVFDVLRDEANEVLELYRSQKGLIYNG